MKKKKKKIECIKNFILFLVDFFLSFPPDFIIVTGTTITTPASHLSQEVHYTTINPTTMTPLTVIPSTVIPSTMTPSTMTPVFNTTMPTTEHTTPGTTTTHKYNST